MGDPSLLKFSIITPSFNQGRFLRQTIRSVLEQDYPAKELIVMDGGSTDDSVSTLEQFSHQIAYWQSQPDGGQTAAINDGIRRGSGDIFGWINSDDFFLPGSFTAAAARFAEDDAPDIVFGYTVYVDAAGRLLRENRFDDFSLSSMIQCGTGMDIQQQAMFWRASLNETLFPLDENLRFCMDLQLILRAAVNRAKFARIPTHLGAFRRHEDSKTTTIWKVRQQEHSRLINEVAAVVNVRRIPHFLWAARRRLHFLRSGEWRYAIGGGSFLLPLTVRQKVDLASMWATQ
jgi:hypothetical protein